MINGSEGGYYKSRGEKLSKKEERKDNGAVGVN